MKKNKLLFAIMLMVTSMGIIAISCNKEKNEESSNIIEKTTGNESNMDEYLTAFKEKLLSAKKGGETICKEQARRDLCNLLNFDFGDANYATDVFCTDTIHSKLYCENGVVDLSRLAVTYSDAISKITASYLAVDLPEKSVYAISCEYDETTDRDGETENIRIVITYRGLGNPLPDGHDTLDWKPTRYSGTCDGSIIHKGAPEVIEQWITIASPLPDCQNGGRLYFTDGGYWYKQGYDTYDALTGRYKIFCMFTNQIDTVCISHADMEYYFHNIMNYWNQEKPALTVVIEPWINCFYDDYNPGPDRYYWQVRILYAKPNCTETDPLM